jgi:putative ABC transport system permease protein
VSILALAFRGLREHRLRNGLTILAVAISIVVFLLLRTVTWAWSVGADAAAQDRIATRHKVTFVMPLPYKYFEEVRAVEGVDKATFATWSDARSPAHEGEFFAALAVEGSSFLDVYDEIAIAPGVREAWLGERKGALVGSVLAKKFGWKVGDHLRLTSGIFPDPGEWEFVISGTYEATRKSIDRSMFLWHYAYLNESIPELRRDYVGWIVSRVRNAGQAGEISKAVDARFDVQDTQTITMSEGEMQKSFLGMAGALLQAIDIISAVILAIMMLLLGNTIAMGVRDRTNQYAVMRAIGFLPKHIVTSVLGEGLAVGLLGGGLGLLCAYPFINQGVGRFIEENMGSYFPYFRITPQAGATALALAASLGVVAAVIPARSAARLDIVDALRKVG